jgi:putative endonuclease
MSESVAWYLYLLECTGNTIYTGITTDVARRFGQHLAGTGAKYTRSHKPLRILASQRFDSKSEALRAEIAVKRLSASEKRAFCEQYAHDPGK